MKNQYKIVTTIVNIIPPLVLFFGLLVGTAQADIKVLWWDSTPTYGGQASDSLREEMCNYLSDFNGGGVFECSYVSNMTQGTFSTHMASNSYDVIVLDSTNSQSSFNSADLNALTNFYSTHPAVLLDGILYIRSINYNATTDFPGINESTGGLTVNEVFQLYTHGGGIMVGTDHTGYHVEANMLIGAMIPGASFSGCTYPSVDGQFNGDDLLNALAIVSPFDLFEHWDSVPTEGIAPTGNFTDIYGNAVTLYSQVDVADDPGGGPKFSYISTSWEPSGEGPQFDCNNNGILDSIDIKLGTSQDCDGNGIPDECDPDCNQNGSPDACDIANGTSLDCNNNCIPDECDIANGTSLDCNDNGIPDACDIDNGTSLDCNGNGIPDICDIANGTSEDQNTNSIPDECENSICGDLDHDGDVDDSDRNILRSVLNTPTGDASFIEEADYDNDGLITYNDYREWYKCYKAFIAP